MFCATHIEITLIRKAISAQKAHKSQNRVHLSQDLQKIHV
jgi:hypothetical protein